MKSPPNKKSKFVQGYYTVINTHKYLGDNTEVVYRSSWELKMFRYLDTTDEILAWGSEIIAIPYMKPTFINGKASVKKAKYYPDIYVELIDGDGKMQRQLIEIKPLKQTKRSRARNAKIKMFENSTYAINQAKWKAAMSWCSTKGINFVVATENDIYKYR